MAGEKIVPIPQVGTNGRTLFIVATLDGFVTLRTPGGDTKLDPSEAEKASKDFGEAARLARHIRGLTAMAPEGLAEEALIAWLRAAFADTPFPESK